MVSIFKSLVGILALGAASSAFADDDGDIYSFVSAGVSKPSHHEFGLNKKFNFSYAPNITVGLAKDDQLSENWLVTNKIGLRAQQASFYGVNANDAKLYGDIKQIGLVAGSRFKYSGFSNTVMPFVEVEASINDTNFSYNNAEQDQWQKGYKVATGLEFRTSEDMSFSISLGYADTSNKDDLDTSFNR